MAALFLLEPLEEDLDQEWGAHTQDELGKREKYDWEKLRSEQGDEISQRQLCLTFEFFGDEWP